MRYDVRRGLLGFAVIDAHKLTRFLATRVGDAVEAQDLMQEIYLRILRLKQPEGIRNPRAYFFKVAANILHEHRLRRNAQPPLVEWNETAAENLRADFEAAESNVPESEAVLAERLEVLRDRLSELSPKVQAAILWHHRDGYTCDEIGERLSVVRHRVKKYLVKGLAHCRGGPSVDATLPR